MRLLTVSLLAACVAATPPALAQARTQPRAITPRGPLDAEETNNINVFRRTSPSVVHITNLAYQRDFFSMRVTEQPQGTGTGFIWDEAGHIVTNFHVIQGGDRATVTLADQSSYPARLVGAYPDRDLAVLRIEAPRDKLPAIAVGSSRELQVGQKVYAIGNPIDVLIDPAATQAMRAAIIRQYGLDLPLWQQYGHFLGNVLRGDFGNSFVFRIPVLSLILSRLPATLELTVLALLIAAVLGVPLGGGERGVTLIESGANFGPLLAKRAACEAGAPAGAADPGAGQPPTGDEFVTFRDEGATLGAGLYALQGALDDPAMRERLVRFVRATMKGFDYAAAHPDEAAAIVLENDETGAQTEAHQLRMAEEVAKLTEGSTGVLDAADYQRTVDTLLSGGSDPVITRAPEGAYVTVITDRAFD